MHHSIVVHVVYEHNHLVLVLIRNASQRIRTIQQQQQQQPFNGPLFGTTLVSWYQRGKTILNLLEQEMVSDSGITPPLSFFTGRMCFLPPNQHYSKEDAVEFHSNSK